MATLGFSTHWPKHMGGGETEFIPKIWRGIIDNKIISENNGAILNYDKYSHLAAEYYRRYNFEGQNKYEEYRKIRKKLEDAFMVNQCREKHPKLHTIRHDSKNLWVPGRKIHMVVFNRTKNRFQFAPVLEVKSVQKIEIKYNNCGRRILIDDSHISMYYPDLKRLIRNDGFEGYDDFFQWFNEDFTGKIIHWTDLKY